MISVETITDIEHLRQVAVLLDRENQRLIKRVTELTAELSCLRGQDAASAQREITKLLEQLQRNRQALFGDSSERRQERCRRERRTSSQPQTGHGPRPQPHLPAATLATQGLRARYHGCLYSIPLRCQAQKSLSPPRPAGGLYNRPAAPRSA